MQFLEKFLYNLHNPKETGAIQLTGATLIQQRVTHKPRADAIDNTNRKEYK